MTLSRGTLERQDGDPVVKGNEKKSTGDNGDGSRHNPVRSKDEILQLDYAKEVKYVQRNGTPGLTFRRGKTNHSYSRLQKSCNKQWKTTIDLLCLNREEGHAEAGKIIRFIVVNQLWFSTVPLACCKTFANCCTSGYSSRQSKNSN